MKNPTVTKEMLDAARAATPVAGVPGLAGGKGPVLDDSEIIRVVMAALNAAPTPGKKTKHATRAQIWEMWNNLPDGTTNAVQYIAGQLGLPAAAVASVVYPEDTFGASCPVCGGKIIDGRCEGYGPPDPVPGCGWAVGESAQ